MTTSHLNLRWSLKDIDEIQSMIKRGLDAKAIAEAFLTTDQEILALCKRNSLPFPRGSNSQQGA